MLLLLMRHGIAEDLEDGAPDAADASRRLTPKGIRQVREMAELLRKLGCEPTHIASSPRRRALETAEIAAEILGGGTPRLVPSLDFEGTWPQFVADALRLTAGNPNATLLATGHEPNCGQFVAAALVHSTEGIHIRKGAVAALSWKGPIAPDGADLRFYLTYSTVRKLEE